MWSKELYCIRAIDTPRAKIFIVSSTDMGDFCMLGGMICKLRLHRSWIRIRLQVCIVREKGISALNKPGTLSIYSAARFPQ